MIVDQPVINFVPKGWGFEKWIANSEKYCGKLLYLVKGKKCSLHYHKLKDETFYVQSGKIRLYYSDDMEELKKNIAIMGDVAIFNSTAIETIVLNPGSNFYVPPGRIHSMLAIEDTELYEFSTQHFDSDSYRIIKGD